jgi:hypothetical protein
MAALRMSSPNLLSDGSVLRSVHDPYRSRFGKFGETFTVFPIKHNDNSIGFSH